MRQSKRGEGGGGYLSDRVSRSPNSLRFPEKELLFLSMCHANQLFSLSVSPPFFTFFLTSSQEESSDRESSRGGGGIPHMV